LPSALPAPKKYTHFFTLTLDVGFIVPKTLSQNSAIKNLAVGTLIRTVATHSNCGDRAVRIASVDSNTLNRSSTVTFIVGSPTFSLDRRVGRSSSSVQPALDIQCR